MEPVATRRRGKDGSATNDGSDDSTEGMKVRTLTSHEINVLFRQHINACRFDRALQLNRRFVRSNFAVVDKLNHSWVHLGNMPNLLVAIEAFI